VALFKCPLQRAGQHRPGFTGGQSAQNQVSPSRFAARDWYLTVRGENPALALSPKQALLPVLWADDLAWAPVSPTGDGVG
jgi:hypothetical protein